MQITDLLDRKSIYLGAKVSSKEETLDRAVALMAESGKIADVETYKKGVYAREEEGTTGIGEGIAIPHCKSAAVKQAGLAAMVIPDGVDFDSLDGEPVHLLFLIAAPDTADNVHLDVLSKLSVLLMDEDFTNALKSAKTVDEFLSIIDKAENGDAKQEEIPTISEATKKILAVTGCPTGIAHTYMAAENIEKKAKEHDALQDIYLKLKRTLNQLTAVNENNKLLLKESMDMIQFELDLAKNAVLKPQTGNYGRTAYEEAEITGATGFDAKQ